jgi:hypothetical protein
MFVNLFVVDCDENAYKTKTQNSYQPNVQLIVCNMTGIFCSQQHQNRTKYVCLHERFLNFGGFLKVIQQKQ